MIEIKALQGAAFYFLKSTGVCATKRLGLCVTSYAIFLAAAVSAFAQQSPIPGGPGPGYGYSPMWGWGWRWHHGMIFGPIVMLLFLVGTVAVIVWLARGGHFGHGICLRCGYGRGRAALDILEERFAKG